VTLKARERGTPLSDSRLAALRALVDEVGVGGAAALAGISTAAVRQALARLGILRGTHLAIEDGLQRALAALAVEQAPRLRAIPGGRA
jgi:hypothetical protein